MLDLAPMPATRPLASVSSAVVLPVAAPTHGATWSRLRAATLAGLATASLCGCFGGGVPPPEYARYNEYLPCSNRIGRCFELSIAGQPVAVIEEEARQQALDSMASQASYEIRDLYWEMREPIDGARAFELSAKPAGAGEKVLGPLRSAPAITVWSLAPAGAGEAGKGADPYSARKTENVVATKLDVQGKTALAPGRYVYEVRYLGQLDWDRKFVHLTVR